MTAQDKSVLWRNVFGEPVDLDNIDKVYAMNILTMALLNRGEMRAWGQKVDVREDPLIQKLREVVLTGRSPGLRDRLRGYRYNFRCWRRGLPYRATFNTEAE